MIDFENYERLTVKNVGRYTQIKDDYSTFDCLRRLAELEDKIENGTLVKLLCKGIEELDIIKKGMIFIFYKMCLEQNLGQGVFLKYKSKINEWFKSYLKNKELQEGNQ